MTQFSWLDYTIFGGYLIATAFIGLMAGGAVALLALPVADLAYYDEKQGWTVEPLEYEAIIARHAEDREALVTRFTVS